jgi:hypothetical protein
MVPQWYSDSALWVVQVKYEPHYYCHNQGRKKEFSSWEHKLETKISCRPTEYFRAKSACA